eukprot:369418_1
MKQTEQEEKNEFGLTKINVNNFRRESQAPFLQDEKRADDDTKNNKPTTPSLHYTKATHTNISNVDKLAFMLNANQMPKLKSVKVKPWQNEMKEQKQNMPTKTANISNRKSPKKKIINTKAKIVSSGAEAELNKITITNTKNAKSKRRKKTR